MLSKDDLAYIKQTRAEVIANRTIDLKIELLSESGEDPFTGEPTIQRVSKVVKAVVTDRTSRVAAERRIQYGAEVIEGDIWFSIDIDEFEETDNPREINHAIHHDVKYEVVSIDPAGIGEMITRYEFVGKRVK